MKKRPVHPFLRLLLTAMALLGALAARAQDSEKPVGFSGYLLDPTGLQGNDAKTAAWKEGFESQGVSWRYLYQDGDVAIARHERVNAVAREGEKSEFLSFDVNAPGLVVLGHYVDYPCVYKETAPSLWLRSNRPGASIAALVVFPKTLRPDNDKPLVAIAPGETYKKPGEWQKLGFKDGLDAVVEKTAQTIRGEHKIPVNVDCAYVRQILLVVEARSGSYSFWIDDLEIEEHLKPSVASLRDSERRAAFDPINLLGCRLKLSNAPVFFAQNELDDANAYGREPFALNEEIVAEKKKPKLVFAPSNDSAPKNSATPETTALPTFELAYEFVKPTEEDYRADLAELFQRRAKLLDSANSERAIAMRTNDGGARVGQTSFVDQTSANKVADAAFDERKRLAIVERQDANATSANFETIAADAQESELVSGSGTLSDPEDAATEAFIRRGERLVADAQFNGGILESREDKRVYLIRAVEHQGEAFAFLKQLGFNAVWLTTPPTAQQLQDANDLGIWIIAPPPSGAQLVQNNAQNKANIDPNLDFGGKTVGSEYDPVLLWNVGAELRKDDLEFVKNRAQRLRELDPRARPIVGSALTGVDEFANVNCLDALILKREPILTSLDLNDYGEWLLKYKNLAQDPRAVFWNTIQTQPAPTSTLQRQFFGLKDESPGIVSYEQMRQLVRFSMRAKCRGLVFSSYSRLDAKDHKTQYRAAALEAINLELQLVAPWFAMGAPDQNLLKTNAQNLSAVVSRAKRAVLVAPVSVAKDNQYVMGADYAQDWAASVAVKEGYSPDLLAPGALRKIVARRKSGGREFALEEGSMNSLVFFSQSDAVGQKISQRAPAYAERMAKLAISLARKRLDLYEETVTKIHYVQEHGAFPKSAPNAPPLGELVERTNEIIQEAELCLQRRDPSQAYFLAERATRELRETERKYWKEATKAEIAKPVTPLSASFYDMPTYLEFYEKLASGKMEVANLNLVVGGDMENRNVFGPDGWKIYAESSDALRATASLDERAAKNGATGLRVAIEPKETARAIPQQVESPLLYVETSFTTNVGALVCIQGWIKIPKDLTNSVDGVEIYDDQGGQALALRFREQTEWKHFAFYRRATNNGSMRLRFAFSGVGEAYLDDVAARVVEQR